MKIDVEGHEREVLEGWDPTILRPWILVVEATVPNSNTPNYSSWEPIVLDAGYRCVYKDGLNRFYLAGEHDELASAFEYPPNVFDEIRLRPHSAMLQDLAAEHCGILDSGWQVISVRYWRCSTFRRSTRRLWKALPGN